MRASFLLSMSDTADTASSEQSAACADSLDDAIEDVVCPGEEEMI
jgi:hypothetical protein